MTKAGSVVASHGSHTSMRSKSIRSGFAADSRSNFKNPVVGFSKSGVESAACLEVARILKNRIPNGAKTLVPSYKMFALDTN